MNNPTEVHKCDHCSYIVQFACGQSLYLRQKALFSHFLRHHSNCSEDQKFVCDCDGCGLAKCDLVKLTQHIFRVHLRPPIGAHSCQVCGAEFRQRYQLTGHTQRYHVRVEKKQDIRCADCDFRTTTKQQMGYHAATRHHATVVGRQCDLCDVSVESQIAMKEHKRRFHTNSSVHICDVCDKTIDSTGRHVWMHFVSAHLSRADSDHYRCAECHQGFLRKGLLYDHSVRVHQPEKKVKIFCAECTDYSTSNKSHLFRHIANRHLTNKNQFRCEPCKLEFKFEVSLGTHNRVQHAGRRMQCDICEEELRTRRNLLRHLNRVHNGMTVEPALVRLF